MDCTHEDVEVLNTITMPGVANAVQTGKCKACGKLMRRVTANP